MIFGNVGLDKNSLKCALIQPMCLFAFRQFDGQWHQRRSLVRWQLFLSQTVATSESWGSDTELFSQLTTLHTGQPKWLMASCKVSHLDWSLYCMFSTCLSAVLSGYTGFFPNRENMQLWLTENAKLHKSVNACVNGCLALCVTGNQSTM